MLYLTCKVGHRLVASSCPLTPSKPPKGKYFESQSINIVSVLTGGEIAGKTFKDCDIWGPAILALNNDAFVSGQFDHTEGTTQLIKLASPLLPLAPGIVLVRDTRFDGCRFHNIGLVDVEASIDATGNDSQAVVTE